MSLPYERYNIIGRCPLEKDAAMLDTGVSAARAVGRWGVRQGRATKHFVKFQGQMVDPRKHQGHYFGKARRNLKTGWGSLSPKTLVNEGQKFMGKGQLNAANLAKNEKFLALQKSNPSYANKIMSSVKNATEGQKGLFYNRNARSWLAAPSQTWGQAWQAGGASGAGKGVLQRAGHRVKSVAEEASRRGWTGASGPGKYLPVGGKGLTAGFIGYGAGSGAFGKLDPGETRLGRIGAEAGSNLGYVAAAPMGLAGLLATSVGWGAAGEAVGRRTSKALGHKPTPQPQYQPQYQQPVQQQQAQYPQQWGSHPYTTKLTVAQRRILSQAARTGVTAQSMAQR